MTDACIFDVIVRGILNRYNCKLHNTRGDADTSALLSIPKNAVASELKKGVHMVWIPSHWFVVRVR